MTDTYPQPATPDVIKSPDPNADGTYPTADEGTDSYDPADGTVEDVKEYIEAHPDERERVLEAERNGQDRVTLTSWLESEQA